MKICRIIGALLFIVALFPQISVKANDASEDVQYYMQPQVRDAAFGNEAYSEARMKYHISRLYKSAWENVVPEKRDSVWNAHKDFLTKDQIDTYRRLATEKDSIISKVKRSLDDKTLEIVRQQRVLASECSVDEHGKLQCISKEEALAKNISEEAYNQLMNLFEVLNKVKTPENISYAIYLINFADNLDDPTRDVLLTYPKLNN